MAGSEHDTGIQPEESVEELQRRAADATIAANLDPEHLTPEEHRKVTELQAKAAHAATEANAALILERE